MENTIKKYNLSGKRIKTALNFLMACVKQLSPYGGGFLLFIATSFPPFGGSMGVCQTTVCTGDSVILTLSGYNGAIQWQQSPDLISWSPASSVMAANDTFGFTATNTYYYRAAVTDGECLPFYSDTTLVTTVNTAPPPTANVASNVTYTSFDANWTVSSGATISYLDVSTSSSFNDFIAGYNNRNVGNVNSFSVTGLNCNITYYYRVRASSGTCGTSGNSGTINVKTSASTLVVPTANAASALSQSSFSANWSITPGATAYYLDVATDAGFTSFVDSYNNRNVGNVTTHTISGLNCNTIYYYQVRATTACETSANSNTITVTTFATMPATPTANAASTITQASFDASWTTVPDAATYYLDVSTDAGFTSFVSGYNDLNVGNVGTYSVTGLNCNTAYHYRVRGFNVCGASGNSGTVDVTTSASMPTSPTANAASDITYGSFSANWTTSSNATTYYIDVATDTDFTSFVAGYNNLNVGNVSAYSVTGLFCNTKYYYRVRASNACGTSINSDQITITTSFSIPDVPTAKFGLAITESSFLANWSASSAASKYYLDVSTDIAFLVFVTGYNNLDVNNDTIFNVTGLTNNTEYYYRIRASNSCGTGLNSNTVSVILPGFCGPSGTCSGNITDSRDNKTYATVQIVNQCWMVENLNIGNRIDGVSEQTNNSIIEKYCYGDDPANCNIYGGLYQWDEMMAYGTSVNTKGPGPRGICPTGWHIPTDNEWKCLEMNLGMIQSEADRINFRGTDEGGKLKQTVITHWNAPNTGATNNSGFTGLPGGYRGTNGSFSSVGIYGFWNSATDDSGTSGLLRRLDYNTAKVVRSDWNSKKSGYSVRCIKD